MKNELMVASKARPRSLCHRCAESSAMADMLH